MAEQRDQSSGGGHRDDEVLRKTDASLRRLLEASEIEIRKRVEHDTSRLEKKLERIERDSPTPSPTASTADRKAIARTIRLRRAELMPHHDLIAVIPDQLKPVRLRAVARFTGNRSDLEDMGLEVRSQAQDVFTVTGTQKQLKDLLNRSACRRLRSPRLFFPNVEDAAAQAEITAVHAPRAVNPNGFQGDGVLVAIIDSPLDVTHHGFRDPTVPGTHDSRVLYYWAQSTHTEGAFGTVGQPNPPGVTPQQFTNAATPADPRPNFAGLNYGRLYTNDDINTAIGLANPYGTGANQI